MNIRLFAALAALVVSHSASAAMWDESVHGDLSNAGLAPSSLALDAGSNVIRGSFRAGDPDYLAVTVPIGYVLNAIVTGTGNNTGLSRSFIGVQAGPVMTVPPTSSSAAGLLGWTHFSVADGIDLLPDMGFAKLGSTGFSGPLQSGSYTFWFNEVSDEPNLSFDMDFRVQAAPVPLPGAAGLLMAGLAFIGRAVRRKAVIGSPARQLVS